MILYFMNESKTEIKTPDSQLERKEKLKLRILIVENEPETAELMAKTFASWGYEVVGIAANEKDALDLLEKNNPNLITMDGDLDHGDKGLDIAAKMRSKNSSVVITMISGSDLKFEGRGIGKPAYGEKLKRHIESLFSKES